MPEPEPAPIRQEEEKRVDVPDDFWEFFDGGEVQNFVFTAFHFIVRISEEPF